MLLFEESRVAKPVLFVIVGELNNNTVAMSNRKVDTDKRDNNVIFFPNKTHP